MLCLIQWGLVSNYISLYQIAVIIYPYVRKCLLHKVLILTPRDVFWQVSKASVLLTHWGRVTHICVSDLTIIGSDNGLAPTSQAITWINAGILLIGPLGTNLSEILIEILIFSFKKMRLKVSSAKRRPFCLSLNVLIWFYSGITRK